MSFVVKSNSRNIVFGVVSSIGMAECLEFWLRNLYGFDAVIETHDAVCCSTFDCLESKPMLSFEI